MLKFVTHEDIDKTRWDECIRKSLNSLIYGHSWFLDTVCPKWNAVIEENYQAVMPLPTKKKWGIWYIYPPVYAQQLGIFGIVQISPDDFLKAIPSKYKFISLKVNEKNIFQASNLKKLRNRNYTLSLNASYESISSQYSENTKRNLNKARKWKLDFGENLPIEDFLSLYKKNYPIALDQHILTATRKLIRAALDQNAGKIWVIKTEDKIHAALFWIEFENRSYYLCPVSTNEGTESRAMFFLIDKIIQKNAGQNHIIDFEGSNIEGVARFYQGFGAQASYYDSISINRLPWPLNQLKKGF